jgi:hypothetical protein
LPPIGSQYEKAIRTHQSHFATRGYDFAVKKLTEEIPQIIKPHLDTAALAAKLSRRKLLMVRLYVNVF